LFEIRTHEIEREELFHLLKSLTDVRIIVSGSNIRIYTNDLEFASDIPSKIEIKILTININRPMYTIIKRNSQFKYRMTFSQSQTMMDHRNSIKQFLKTYDDVVENSTLKFILQANSSLWTLYQSSRFFIDYNDESMQMIFNLIAPGIKTKVFRLIDDPAINTIQETKT